MASGHSSEAGTPVPTSEDDKRRNPNHGRVRLLACPFSPLGAARSQHHRTHCGVTTLDWCRFRCMSCRPLQPLFVNKEDGGRIRAPSPPQFGVYSLARRHDGVSATRTWTFLFSHPYEASGHIDLVRNEMFHSAVWARS